MSQENFVALQRPAKNRSKMPASFLLILLLNWQAFEISEGQFCEKDDCSSNVKDNIKPFGQHRPSEGTIKTLKYSPSGSDFYSNFVHARTPVIIKGAANHWPAMTRWVNQSYLREHYGSTPFTVEYRKKFKNEQPIRKPQRLDSFLDIFDKENVYLDSSFPPSAMIHDINMPEFLGCNELSDSINSMTLLFSSGNTTSPLHQDGFENVLTSISGTKTFLLIDPKYSPDLYADDHYLFPGISTFDGDAIDFAKFPKLANVPYYEVTLYPGDMLYVPQYWWHLVRSYNSPNIAVNIWLAVFNFYEEFEKAGLDEDKDIVKVNGLFESLVKTQPSTIQCDNENPHLDRILKIDLNDTLFTPYLRIPKKNERPSDVMLASGYTMPVMGFGTFALKDTLSSVKMALDVGYRLFDTAQAYPGSEEQLGRAIKESNVMREDIFITTKLHSKYLGYDSTLKAVEMSLKALQTDYIDLFLIHRKNCDDFLLACDGEPEGDWKDSWKAMEEMHRHGKIRSLGLSNFYIDDLKELMDFATIPVSALQNWFDPFHQDRKTREFCNNHTIRYIGSSTLGSQWVYSYGLKKNPVLKSGIINEVSYHYEYVPSQVVLRWAIHLNVTVIPRSNNPRNIALNFRALDLNLSESEIESINDIVEYEFHPLERLQKGEGSCLDLDTRCPTLAKEGKCTTDSAWMLENCKNSCKICYAQAGSALQPFVYVGSEDQHMYAIGVLYGDIQWKYPTNGKILSTAALSHDSESVYFGSNDGSVYALKASTGKLLWSFKTKGGVVAGPRISLPGVLYIGSHDNTLYALDTLANGTIKWKKDLGGPIYSSVTIGEENGSVYVGTAADERPRVFGFSAKTGEQLWEFAKSGKIMSSPTLSTDGKVVYFCSLDHFIYALDTNTGIPIWSLDTGSEIESSPYISKSDGTLYVGLVNDKLLAVNTLAGPLRGTVKWTLNTGGEVISSPVLTENGKLFIGVGDGRILAINASTSDIIWGPTTNNYVASSVAVGVDSVVYVGSTDSTVYALNGKDGSIVWTVKTNGSISSSSPVLSPSDRMTLG